MTEIQFNTLLGVLRRLQLDVTSLKRKLNEIERLDRKSALSDTEITQKLAELEDHFAQLEAKFESAEPPRRADAA